MTTMLYLGNRNHGKGSVIFSGDRKYRYLLTRRLTHQCMRPRRTILWVMLNPSSADNFTDDNTVKQISAFSLLWSFDDLAVCNLFGLISTDPKGLYEHEDPVGSENDKLLVQEAYHAHRVVCAWGAHGVFQKRDRAVYTLLQQFEITPSVLGLTKDGCPRHPLRLSRSTKLTDWEM